ncbi:MAG: autotransporter domain-containing protein [Deferribacterales bacterium]
MRKLILVALMFLTCAVSFATNSVSGGPSIGQDDSSSSADVTNTTDVDLLRTIYDDDGYNVYFIGLLFGGTSGLTLTNNGTISVANDYSSTTESDVVSGYLRGIYDTHAAGTLINNRVINVSSDTTGLTVGYHSESNIYGIQIDSGSTYASLTSNAGIYAEASITGGASSVEVDALDIYGIYANTQIANLENNSDIIAGFTFDSTNGSNYDVIAGSSFGDHKIAGIYYAGGSYFTNGTTGNILGYFSSTGATFGGDLYVDYLYGVDVDGTLSYYFQNDGVIGASIDLDSPSFTSLGEIEYYYIYGAYMFGADYIGNTGTIYADTAVKDVDNSNPASSFYSGAIYGLYVDSSSASYIENSGRITADVSMENSKLGYFKLYDTTGVYVNGDVYNSFTNQTGGVISTSLDIDGLSLTSNDGYGVALEAKRLYGTYVENSAVTFTNDGTISTSANLSGVESSDIIKLSYIYGVYVGDSVTTFANNGNISASVNVTDSLAAGISIDQLYGAAYYGGNSFDNNGSISVSFSATGSYSYPHFISYVYALYPSGVTDVTNDGTLSATVSSESEASYINVGAVYLRGSDTFTNNGDISLTVNGASGSTTTYVAAMRVDSSAITINNPGEVYIESNLSDSSIRTLYIEYSDATFGDYFTIAAGGFTGSENVGAIYVDNNSTLHLNDSILGVTMNSHLALDTAYKVIENDGGTVDGTFSGLRPFTNADYTLAWATSERGEDAEVTISYDPKESAPAHTVASVAGAMGVVSNLFSGRVLSGSFFSGGGAGGGAGGGFGGFSGFSGDVSYLGGSDILLADSGEIATDAGLSYVPAKKKSSVFAFPFYSKQSGDGYDSKTSGMGVGFARRFMDGVTGTAYLGRMSTDTDYDSVSMDKTESDSTFLGAALNYDKGIYASASLIGFMTDNNYEGYNGADNEYSESADYSSKGMQMELTGGYSFKIAQGVRLVPFGGLSLSYYDMDAYNTDVAGTANDAYNTYYDSYSDWDTSLIAGVSAEKNIKLGSGALKVFGQYRYDIAIGNNDIVINQSVPGLNTGDLSVEQSVDNGTHKLGLGTEFSKVNWYTSAYGEYSANADYDSMSFKLTAGYKF